MKNFFLSSLCILIYSASLAHGSVVDPPHNETNGITCGTCHTYSMWWQTSPTAQLGNPDYDTKVNALCLTCHDSNGTAPAVKGHGASAIGSAKYHDGLWIEGCTACHDPHFQSQLNYAATDAGQLYIARGAILSVSPGDEASTFEYSLSTAVSPIWQDPATWPAKTGADRGLEVAIDTSGSLSVFEILAAQDSPTPSITVKGKLTQAMANQPFGIIYGQLIRHLVETPSGVKRPVKFFDAATLFTDQQGSPLAGGPVDLRPNETTPQGLCQVCHTETKYYQPTSGGHFQEPCRNCHQHDTGFGHAGGANGTGCDSCHGHDAGWGGSSLLGKGTYQSHSTHTENDADDARGPMLSCDRCHNMAMLPSFKSGIDADNDGRISLAETGICDSCHSPDGPFDGVNDPEVGAKANWRHNPAKSSGIYRDATLAPGKEKWCLTCHDSGTSVIPAGSAYKPQDFAGNNSTYGYYVSGHGSKVVECDGCHDLTVSHNFDGKRTYKAALNNYRQGYRLKRMADGSDPFRIPVTRSMTQNDGCDYRSDDYKLCYSCHAEHTLLSHTKGDGTYECQVPASFANQPSLLTGFRNVSSNGDNGGLGDIPANIHWDHLVDIHSIFNMASFWDSDQDGVNDTKATCVTCHNPHGPAGNQTDPESGKPLPTVKMTVKSLDIESGQDATGSYGQFGPAMNTSRCFMCHFGPGGKYYRDAVPAFHSFTVSDRSTPVTATLGYSNERRVKVQLNVTTIDPAEMRIAEQMFTDENTGWAPLPPTTMEPVRTTEFEITSPGQGTKTLYAQVRNASGASPVLNSTIVLDTIPPAVPANALTAPNGGESWQTGTTQAISYLQLAGTDLNLATCAITLELSSDGGTTYPHKLPYLYCFWLTTNDWLVAAPPTQTARFRLTVTDRAGNSASDASDATFTITP